MADRKPPHRRTIEARLEDVDLQKRAQRRGEKKIVKATTATPGTFSASRPTAVVQAMDVCSRMVSGFYLTMEAPSRLSTSLCLLHSVFDKSAWLREREIVEPWPVAGLPETLHVDNGADFRSQAFKRGCQNAGIAIASPITTPTC
ncbi:hypothetical protein [Mesorhizobium sp. M0276]|uniref:hypothetical protein n=1 Tax=Mesorhizobium sp. M0276 TaxID=2956928 RepID=UPI00333D6A21